MANPHRGEADLVVDGTTYKLRMSFNILCGLEDRLQMDTADIMAALPKAKMGLFRAVMCAAMSEFKPGITEDGAGDIIQATGITAAKEALLLCMARAFPTPEKAKGASPKNP